MQLAPTSAPPTQARGPLTLNELLTLLVGFSSLIIGLGSLAVSWQSFQMSKDNTELRLAVKGIADLATETKRQADSQAAHLAVLQDQARQAGLQTRAISQQTTAIKDSSVAAIVSARAQTQAAEVATIAQRANISLTAVDITGFGSDVDAEGNVPVTLTWTVMNVGGSTIVHKPSHMQLFFAGEGMPGAARLFDFPWGGNEWTVTSGGSFQPRDPASFKVTKDIAERAKAGKLSAVILGEVAYQDNRGALHNYCVAIVVPLKDGGGSKFWPVNVPSATCKAS